MVEHAQHSCENRSNFFSLFFYYNFFVSNSRYSPKLAVILQHMSGKSRLMLSKYVSDVGTKLQSIKFKLHTQNAVCIKSRTSLLQTSRINLPFCVLHKLFLSFHCQSCTDRNIQRNSLFLSFYFNLGKVSRNC